MEEAETKLGGAENLKKAVARGAAIISQHKGQDVVYIPRITVGDRHSYINSEVASREKAIKDTSFATIRNTVQSLGWQVPSTVKEAIEDTHTCLLLYCVLYSSSNDFPLCDFLCLSAHVLIRYDAQWGLQVSSLITRKRSQL